VLTPAPRGELSREISAALTSGRVPARWPSPSNADDAALALWTLHELHYRGFDDAGDELEWHPDLVAVRGRLEKDFEEVLRTRHNGVTDGTAWNEEDFFELVASHEGPSIARHVQRTADEEQVRELLRLRSVYHLKETDPVAWTLPRLPAATQAALVELLYDEYGAGHAQRHHATLFAEGLRASGLDATYGAHVGEAPTEVLEQNNAMTMFGLQRRLRGAALGHLAAFEATSSLPSRQMAQGLERLGFPEAMIGYYKEHVAADAVHEQLAVRTVCGSLVAAEPELVPDVLFGAFTCLDLEDRIAHRLLASWQSTEPTEAVA
jgi:hypothetical protein